MFMPVLRRRRISAKVLSMGRVLRKRRCRAERKSNAGKREVCREVAVLFVDTLSSLRELGQYGQEHSGKPLVTNRRRRCLRY